MASAGNISEVTITGSPHAGAQATLCPTTESTDVFLRHLIEKLIAPVGRGRYATYVTTAGLQTIDRQAVTGIAITIS